MNQTALDARFAELAAERHGLRRENEALAKQIAQFSEGGFDQLVAELRQHGQTAEEAFGNVIEAAVAKQLEALGLEGGEPRAADPDDDEGSGRPTTSPQLRGLQMQIVAERRAREQLQRELGEVKTTAAQRAEQEEAERALTEVNAEAAKFADKYPTAAAHWQDYLLPAWAQRQKASPEAPVSVESVMKEFEDKVQARTSGQPQPGTPEYAAAKAADRASAAHAQGPGGAAPPGGPAAKTIAEAAAIHRAYEAQLPSG